MEERQRNPNPGGLEPKAKRERLKKQERRHRDRYSSNQTQTEPSLGGEAELALQGHRVLSHCNIDTGLQRTKNQERDRAEAVPSGSRQNSP